MVKLGNTSFDEVELKDVSFEQFESVYKGLLQGYDLKKAWQLLTGNTPVILPKHGKGGKVSKSSKESK